MPKSLRMRWSEFLTKTLVAVLRTTAAVSITVECKHCGERMHVENVDQIDSAVAEHMRAGCPGLSP